MCLWACVVLELVLWIPSLITPPGSCPTNCCLFSFNLSLSTGPSSSAYKHVSKYPRTQSPFFTLGHAGFWGLRRLPLTLGSLYIFRGQVGFLQLPTPFSESGCGSPPCLAMWARDDILSLPLDKLHPFPLLYPLLATSFCNYFLSQHFARSISIHSFPIPLTTHAI